MIIMLAKVNSACALGIDACKVTVEVDIANGIPSFSIVGLPCTAIKESRDRIRSAIKNSGFDFPTKRITVNLAPADVKKEGAGFDLPIAVAILVATNVLQTEKFKDYIICGEVSLNGEVKPIKGALPIALGFSKTCMNKILLPFENIREAAIVEAMGSYPARNLREVIDFLNDQIELKPERLNVAKIFRKNSSYRTDFSDVKGQEHVKRGLEVTAAGSHNCLLIGPPGSGKSMLAKRLPTILSKMDIEESLETSKIHSVAGLLSPKKALTATRPFRSPHHTISNSALTGGGSYPNPGEISLAHNGVLFLDELPEFKRTVLEVMRQPLEDQTITIARVAGTLTYPARFMLVAAMNPCPCGFFTDPKKECRCTPAQIQKYLSKISGPLLDRIDIHLEAPRLNYEQLSKRPKSETSSQIKQRVDGARAIQRKRYKKDAFLFNAFLEPKEIEKYCPLSHEGQELLKMAILELGLSARTYDKVLKVARTIADLDQKETIEAPHISEAIGYRSLDRNLWV